MSPPCKGNLGKLMGLMDGTLRPGTADRMRQHLSSCPVHRSGNPLHLSR